MPLTRDAEKQRGGGAEKIGSDDIYLFVLLSY